MQAIAAIRRLFIHPAGEQGGGSRGVEGDGYQAAVADRQAEQVETEVDEVDEELLEEWMGGLQLCEVVSESDVDEITEALLVEGHRVHGIE